MESFSFILVLNFDAVTFYYLDLWWRGNSSANGAHVQLISYKLSGKLKKTIFGK